MSNMTLLEHLSFTGFLQLWFQLTVCSYVSLFLFQFSRMLMEFVLTTEIPLTGMSNGGIPLLLTGLRSSRPHIKVRVA